MYLQNLGQLFMGDIVYCLSLFLFTHNKKI